MKQILLLSLVVLTLNTSCKNDSCECGLDSVCVEVVNSSEQEISSLSIVTKDGIDPTNNQLLPGEKTCLSFKSPGENAFKVIGVLASGDTISSGEEYSEGGYEFSAVIKKDTINIGHAEGY